jgi:hypothetical protein
MLQTASRKPILSALLATAAVMVLASAAQAGFEWKGSAAAPAAIADTGGMSPAPNGADINQGMSMPAPDNATITWDGIETGAMPAEKVGAVETAPVAPPAFDAMPLRPMETPTIETLSAPIVESASGVVDGFGSDLPLAIALQQIVPAGQQFSFAPGANPGQIVSWSGGKSWQSVLKDALSPHGLGYEIKGSVVRILPANQIIEAKVYRAPPAPAMPAPPIPMNIDAPLSLTSDAEMPDVSGVQSVVVTKTTTSHSAPIDIRRKKPSSLLNRVKNLVTPGEKSVDMDEKVDVKSDAVVSVQKEEVKEIPAAEISYPPVPESYTPVPLTSAPAVTSGVSWDSPAAPAAAMAQTATWHGARGQTLRDVLKNWSDVAGVELYWSIDYDYRLDGDASYPGSYEEAVGQLMDRFADIRPQPYGQLHQGDGGGPRVLVVKSYDVTE